MSSSDGGLAAETLRECTPDAFLVGRPGDCVFNESFCYFRAKQSLYGAVAWGRPSVSQYERLLGLHAMAQRAAEPHLSIIDLREVEQIDGAGVQLAAQYMAARRETTETKIIRQAVLLPSRVVAAASIAGLYQVSPPYHPLRLFSRERDALEWLHEPLPGLVDGIVSRIRERRGRITPTVRALLATRPAVRSLNSVAAELRVSPRTLQRRLHAEGTTFAAEFRTAWIGQARQQLAQTDVKLKEIAAELGFASLQSFSAAFKRESGQCPREWRDHARRMRRHPDEPGRSADVARQAR